MAICTGNGTCFQHCECICYDEASDEDHPVCVCGHRNHDSEFCRTIQCVHNCQMKKCKNFDVCGISYPQWNYDNLPGDGLCFECWAYRGELKNSIENEECAICLDSKIVVELQCDSRHKVCMDCWEKTIHSKKYPSTCPLCRKQIGAWKVNMSGS